MTHQVLEEYNRLPIASHKQVATTLLKLLCKYLIMVTFENSENYSIRNFEWWPSICFDSI